MQNVRSILVLFFSLLIVACGNSTQKKINSTDTSIVDTSKFYPINLFIQAQIQFVDLRNFIITKTSIPDTTKQVISKAQFIIAASEILKEAIEWSKQKQLYKETVFQDLSTASYTINYTAINPSTSIQRVDILLSEETNIIKRLFIRKNQQIRDTTITQQFSWVADHSFQISSSAIAPNYNKTTASVVNWSKQGD